MRARREEGEPSHICDDLQDRPDETEEPGLDHGSRGYAITADSNARFRPPAGSDSERSVTFAEISRGTEFLRITPKKCSKICNSPCTGRNVLVGRQIDFLVCTASQDCSCCAQDHDGPIMRP